MASVNKVILVGNLGRDPEIRYLPSGDPVANITIATSSKYKGKDGNMVEETEWHRITLWGKLAEIASQYLHKGDKIFIEGKIRTCKWQDQSGQDRYSTEITADNMLMLGGRPANDGYGQQQTYYQPPPQANPPRQAPPTAQPRPNYQASAPQHFQSPPPGLDFDDDIPF